VGAHIGYSKTRRHPSTLPFIFTTKTRGDVINLEKTEELLKEAREFIQELAATGKMVLFVGTKAESRQTIRGVADALNMPYIDNRWIGGTLTNFKEIRKRVDRLMDLQYKREHNELVFKTKKEKLMIEREIAKLEKNFGGLILLKEKPAAVIVVDSDHEDISVAEANQTNVPIISISNTDCNIDKVQYPVVANDAAVSSITYFVKTLAKTYQEST
jgi:small subunit ribosomal protein S2